MNWYKKAQGYLVPKDPPLNYPYSLLEIIKMQENGLPLNTMDPGELQAAKSLEENGLITKVTKQDDKGNYSAYVIKQPFEFKVGQRLTFNYPKVPYKNYCDVTKINPDGTLDVLDHSGRWMKNFKPYYGKTPMFKEMIQK